MVYHGGSVFIQAFNFVIVVPEAVRTKALFIDKRNAVTDMFDFRQPPVGTEPRNADPIHNGQAVVHPVGQITDNLEIEIGGRELVKILRGCNEIPKGFTGGVENYFTVKCMHSGLPSIVE